MFCTSFCLSDQQIHVREQAEIFLCRGHKIRVEETHDPHVPLHTPGTVTQAFMQSDLVPHGQPGQLRTCNSVETVCFQLLIMQIIA